MRISATITNTMVRSSSLPDRPTRGPCVARARARRDLHRPLARLPSCNVCLNRRCASSAMMRRTHGLRQTWRKKVDGRAFADFRQRRIGQNDAGHRANIEPLRQRQHPGRDQFAGLRADDCRAEDLALAVGDDLDVAVGLALGLRAVVVVIGPAQDADLDLALARFRFGQARLRKLRIGIGNPGHDVVVRRAPAAGTARSGSPGRRDNWRRG